MNIWRGSHAEIERLEARLDTAEKLADYLVDLCGNLCKNLVNQEQRMHDLEGLIVEMWRLGTFPKGESDDIWKRIRELQVRPWALIGGNDAEKGR